MTSPRHLGIDTVLWRCTKCGKWSHAQRRPLHHQHFAYIPTDHGDKVEVTYCGPFRRFVAFEEDAEPPSPHRLIGHEIPSKSYEIDHDTAEDFPF